ncbi:MAG: carboxymuconolactone decarboxylase family protein [Firmicutes bacterium]|nr:carboxymuconolactone decarboxylase family protein [Alicyclobacillaceae bacterium]MCL6496735.1 carboxymuconolactone decarboxylase family protein [Bacillota bacterium]
MDLQHPSPSAKPRLDWGQVVPEAREAMLALERAAASTGLAPTLLELVKVRVSQINGCAYCLDMHTKNARALGESEQRLYALVAWRETPFFDPRERAALAWAEAITRIGEGVSDTLYEAVRAHFSERELVGLTAAVVAINGWNRWSIGMALPAGSYRPDRTPGGASSDR